MDGPYWFDIIFSSNFPETYVKDYFLKKLYYKKKTFTEREMLSKQNI